jgi:hypothetical protein
MAWRGQGVRVAPDSERRLGGSRPGARRVRLGPFGRDDKRAPLVSGWRERARTDSEEEGRWAVGRKLAWGGVLPRGLFFNPIRFPFCFLLLFLLNKPKMVLNNF